MTKSNSGREKHSYIPFYMDDWQGGTAGMTRMIKSVYFDICLFNWDKCKPMTPAHYTLITQDLQEMGPAIIDLLIDTDKIVLDPERGYYSPRALSVGIQSFEVWKAKSEGGRKGGRNRGTDDDIASNAKSTAKGKLKDTSSKSEAMLKESDHNQNQNQNQNQEEATASSGGGGSDSKNDVEEDGEALARITEAARLSEELKLGTMQIVDTWNAMAAVSGLPQVSKMTEDRTDAARALVAEFGADTISDAFRSIPDSDFLLGGGPNNWRVKFDWLMDSDNFRQLMEGNYHAAKAPEPESRPAPKPKAPIAMPDDPDNKRQVTMFREKLKGYVGDAAYTATFEKGTAIVFVENNLIDVFFRNEAEKAIAQASYEGAVLAAGKFMQRSIRLKTLADVPAEADVTKHIDTERNEADKEALEGKQE